jgi:MarR family 2-MHQ and catechol resistance regulon transcriptional repressor
MTAAVDRLEKKGLIVRTAAPGDRRAKRLELTAEGKCVAQAAFQRHAAELQPAFAVLDEEEKQQLYALLKKLGLFASRKEEKRDDQSSQK